jgi:peptidoglycan/xylan/chitin deacetylase (PgdA/CDA1 family)
MHCNASAKRRRETAPSARQALIAVTMDLEMSRHYPEWGTTRWDYEKGNLDEPTQQYALQTCRRVKAAGGVVHAFLLGRTLEHENVDWLREIVGEGHRLGNHSYDHVKINARTPQTVQFRFRLAPWLIRGRSPREVIEENIRMTAEAANDRLGVRLVGFRTPYGFSKGLAGRTDVQEMLVGLGFDWVSSMYVQPQDLKRANPSDADFAAITRSVEKSQPFVYPSGLVEVPVAPITDVNAFRTRQWKLDHYLQSLRRSLQWAIDHRAAFDYMFHPSLMCVEDPRLCAVDLVCEMVQDAGGKASIVGLDAIARRTKLADRLAED